MRLPRRAPASHSAPGGPDASRPSGGSRLALRASLAALLAAAIVGPAFACGDGGRPGAAGDGGADAAAYGGTVRPDTSGFDFTLRDTGGRPYDFREETEGRLALLFFGYTHCPDVCPVQMANLASSLRGLPGHVRDSIEVVFVTTDPDRDTPDRIRDWLDRFDASFVGLRGTREEVNALLSELELPGAMDMPPRREGEGYLVGHPSHLIAFPPEREIRVLYPAGMRGHHWARELPKLLGG